MVGEREGTQPYISRSPNEATLASLGCVLGCGLVAVPRMGACYTGGVARPASRTRIPKTLCRTTEFSTIPLGVTQISVDRPFLLLVLRGGFERHHLEVVEVELELFHGYTFVFGCERGTSPS